ncbi:hypothetical protein ACLKA7_014739 [Drosophila subpalustris]
MGTPRKNLNYFSPYSQNVGQYPSQTSDYMSQHTGGFQPQETQQQKQPNFQRGTPHFYQSRTPQQQNSGFFEDRQGSNANSTPHFYRNKMPHQQQGSSNRNFGHRGGRRGFHHQQQKQRQFNDNKNVDTYSQYFHSSMLEDPWHELMERFNAIYGSVVDDEQQKRDSDT